MQWQWQYILSPLTYFQKFDILMKQRFPNDTSIALQTIIYSKSKLLLSIVCLQKLNKPFVMEEAALPAGSLTQGKIIV